MLSPRHPAQIVLGLSIWALCFVLLYGALSVACVVAPPDVTAGIFNWLNASLLLLTLATTALLLWLAWRCWASARALSDTREHFVPRIAAACHLAAAGATLMLGLPVIALPPCL